VNLLRAVEPTAAKIVMTWVKMRERTQEIHWSRNKLLCVLKT